MLRSMYSGISGMKVNQTKLDVAGNNIANVGTTGFKSSRVRFQDMLSQNVSEALGPGRNTGGVNPRQVGLGVQVAGIDTIVSQGMMQPTSRNLDVAVDGTGYFVVAKGAIPQSNATGISVDESSHTMSGSGLAVSFTRDGSFTLDNYGNLLTSDGYRVMGYALQEKKDEDGNTKDIDSIDYSANGTVNFVDSDSKYGIKASGTLVPLRIPDSVHIEAFSNAKDKDGTEITTDMGYTGTGKLKKDDGTNLLTASPKLQITEPATNGKYRGDKDLKIEVKWVKNPKNNADGTKWDGTGDAPSAGYRGFINGDEKGEVASTKIEVDKNGKIKGVDEDYKEADKINEITLTGEPAGMDDADKDKYSWSFTLRAETDKKIRSFSIEKEGIIKAVLDDGSVSALGQIAMASFKNPEGLKKAGKNMLENTANSGVPIIRSGVGAPAGTDNGDGYGDMLQGMLEMSNVDLSEQFTDMIVTTRAFQAAGKMISTGDEILQDIINLKR
ncbi:flagellar hook protein FlgE [Clostridium sp. ZS2-4]|uniref:flagellar hook protein FlgE n=1 Tax=Clostridium sp. ZS2-4 TaxID=2987703 RepID=UPI00227D3D28|nr:flagellar hook-basal body complex protein [Clostridium sp. ZS2-4]MCY6354008.1 flagellar hook-basal body complex protein [Clostridium sp. ZS2-4]